MDIIGEIQLVFTYIIPKPIDNKPSQSPSAATWPLETKTKNLSALQCK